MSLPLTLTGDPTTTTTTSTIASEDDDNFSGVCHGVHVQCQWANDWYMTACGILVDPSEFDDSSGKPDCLVCFAPGQICPVCGKVCEE